ncbi:unnamed protein product [Linum tenue]|uniref:RING-type E3 ubiquitin transferase n=1 Tax=Linum tenue TaxID=586396 RepID=A0AAV0IR65_9ROSI|nr:unnamed protein product [Linum tenue]
MMESGIPCFSYKQGRDGSASAVVEYCVVCLEKLAVGESCRLLPNCSHCFHARCIDSWLLQTPVCPICRAGVDVVASPVSGSDSGELVSGLVEDG